MKLKRTFFFLLLASLISSLPLSAKIGSAKIIFQADRWIPVALEVDGVVIEKIKFSSPPKIRKLITKHDKPNWVKVKVVNTGPHKADAGVAVALFDKEGNLLAAGNSGTSIGALRPGEKHNFKIHFVGVFRELDKAKYVIIALET